MTGILLLSHVYLLYMTITASIKTYFWFVNKKIGFKLANKDLPPKQCVITSYCNKGINTIISYIY